MPKSPHSLKRNPILRMVRVSSFPEDLQVLLGDLLDDRGIPFPESVPVKTVSARGYLRQADSWKYSPGDERGDPQYLADLKAYIEAGGEVPPIIVEGNKLVDGRHRLLAMRPEKIEVIDLNDMRAQSNPQKGEEPLRSVPKPPSDRFLKHTCGLMGDPEVDYVLSYDPAFPLSHTGSDTEFFDSENEGGEYDGLIEDWAKHPEQEPVVLCADGHILDGWHRLGLANKLGWETIPAWVVRRGSAGAKSQISSICSDGDPLHEAVELVVAEMQTFAFEYNRVTGRPPDAPHWESCGIVAEKAAELLAKRGWRAYHTYGHTPGHAFVVIGDYENPKPTDTIVDLWTRTGELEPKIFTAESVVNDPDYQYDARTSVIEGLEKPRYENPSKSQSEYFWGKAGAGILFRCAADGTYLLVLRSRDVLQPGTLGIPGGSCSGEGLYLPGEGVAIRPSDSWECAKRETIEELRWFPDGEVRHERTVVFQKVGFQYTTFIVDLTAAQKEEAERSIQLNWENEEFIWMTAQMMIDSQDKLHFGVKYVLEQIHG